MTRVTSKDVARAASVSQTTVSIVFRGGPDNRISEQTRQLVRDTADRLGYVPSARGRALRAGHSNVVVGVVPDLAVSEAMEVFQRALSRALEEAGYACVFLHPTLHAQPLSAVWQRVDPAAVVAFDYLPEQDAADLRRAQIPYVDGVLLPEPVPFGGLDQTRVGAIQVEHLAARGHRLIGYAAASDDREDVVCRLRLEGAKRAAAELGLPELRVVSMGYSAAGALRALHSFRDTPSVTAIAAYGDVLAIGLLNASRLLGIDVPHDLAIVGVDDIQLAALSVPPLSTVVMDLTIPAHYAAARILELVGDDTVLSDLPTGETIRLTRRGTS